MEAQNNTASRCSNKPDASVSPKPQPIPASAVPPRWSEGNAHWDILVRAHYSSSLLSHGDKCAKHPRAIRVHSTLSSISFLGYLQCRQFHNLPTDICFRSSHPDRIPHAPGTLEHFHPLQTQLQLSSQKIPCTDNPGTPWLTPSSASAIMPRCYSA